MNDHEKLLVKIDALTARVKLLEKHIRPLIDLEGVDPEILSDQAVVSFAAESAGSTLTEVAGPSRTSQATAARRWVIKLLRQRAKWSNSRVARALNRSERAVWKLQEATK